MTNKNAYVHYGCGVVAPSEWSNYDVSPTLRIQKIPLIGKWVAKNFKNLNFPGNIIYGNIIKGLNVSPNSCKGVFSSHVLEHLYYEDCKKVVQNSYNMLAPGGIFRFVMPDLEKYARRYLNEVESGNVDAAHLFMQQTCLGALRKPKGLKEMAVEVLGNYQHRWMWDTLSMKKLLQEVGFKTIRKCEMGDCVDPMFTFVERPSRFVDFLAFECVK